MLTITTAIIKGGTGKTATSAALAQAGVADGKRVLAIDLDPQANLTFSLGGDQNLPGAYQLLTGTAVQEVLQETDQGLFVIPGSPDLSTLTTSPGSAARLKKAIRSIQDDFDLCLIDTPPMLGELLFNALMASDGLLIPLETDTNSLQGLYQITDIAHQLQKSNPQLSILGVILSRYDARPNINRYMKETIAQKGGEIGAPLLGEIRPGIVVREASALQKSLFAYAPQSKPALDFMEIYRKVVGS